MSVWWLAVAENTPPRGYWDQAMLEDLFRNRLWDTGLDFVHTTERPDASGCVVVVPGRSHGGWEPQITSMLAGFAWVLMVVTGDEERVFDWRAVQHPRIKVWVQTPQEKDQGADGFLPVGYTPHTEQRWELSIALYGWVFMGQVTHRRRHECVEAAVRDCSDIPHRLVTSASFTAGLPHAEYAEVMRHAEVALCPSGPVCVDTFRVWEALESGTVPIVDTHTPRREDVAYWAMLFDAADSPPLPFVDSWSDLRTYLDAVLYSIHEDSMLIEVMAWWRRYKRSIATRFARQVRDLAGIADEADDRITVLVATSPIPSHPSTDTIRETIDSIRTQLPRADIIVMADGARPELAERAKAYEDHLSIVNRVFRNVIVDYDHKWRHQANTAKRAMRLVETQEILFVEHDTPLDVPAEMPLPLMAMLDGFASGDVRWLRFHHEAQVHPEHRWLMRHVGEPLLVHDVPMLGTMQWSQRPHLASTGDYRWMLDRYFGDDSRTMIEDTMHGVLDTAWREREFAGWDEWRLWIYAPPGTMKRSIHIDGRSDDPKFDMIFEYDQDDVPEGAPYPTSRRTD